MNKTWTNIKSLHELYRQKKLKPSEVTHWYLDNIRTRNPTLNAYITVCEELAIKIAGELDSKIDLIDSFPLFGVPIGLKDLYMTKDILTTAGSNVLREYIGQYDATVVTKYKSAGAVILGKLNCDAWAHGSSGENSDFGPTKNPWNIDYVPGGSSSGSAAAVAADMCLVAGGTDTGGSVRCPASFCSVVGLKPTYGRVSRSGVISMASSLDSVGHFGSSVYDVARVLEVTAGLDTLDATSSYEPVKKYSTLIDSGLKGKKIGVPKEFMKAGLDQDVSDVILKALNDLESCGAIISEISLPHSDSALAAYYVIQPAEVSSNLARFDGIRMGKDRSFFGEEAKRRIMLGTYTLSSGYYDAYYKTAQKVRTKIIDDFNDVFESVDLMAGPVMPHPAFKIGEKVSDPLSLYLEDILTVPVNLAGLPAISVPAGFSSNKLPIGLQLIANYFEESQLLSAAAAFEAATNWHNEHPIL